jgi:hypothetical protein
MIYEIINEQQVKIIIELPDDEPVIMDFMDFFMLIQQAWSPDEWQTAQVYANGEFLTNFLNSDHPDLRFDLDSGSVFFEN